MGEETWNIDDILATLRTSGGRITATKRALVQALVETRDHVTAEALTAAVQIHAPEASPSTIYRNLEELEQLGIVVHAHLGRAAAVYHLAGPVHGHLLCSRCGATLEVPSTLFEPLVHAVRRDFDFDVDRHHLAISGMCGSCRDAELHS